METKRNLKYFLSKGIPVITIIGLAILLIGAIFAFFIPQLRVIGIIAIVVGFGWLIFTSGSASNDTDIDFACHEKVKDIEEEAEKKFEVFERSFLKMIRPVHISGFQFDEGEGFYCKKGSDGRHRSSVFGATAILFTNEKMHIYTKKFSLTDENVDSVEANVIYYTKLNHVELQEGNYSYIRNNKQYNLKTYKFVVFDEEGKEVYNMYIDFGADAEKAVADINHVFEVRKKAAAERAAERAADKLARDAAVEAEISKINKIESEIANA